MRVIQLTAPIQWTIDNFDEERTRFVVMKEFEGPAVTITRRPDDPNYLGDEFDRDDGHFPPIEIQCNWKSEGIKLDRCDNAAWDSIQADRSRGTALDVVSNRQSHFRTIKAAQCIGDSPVVRFRSARVGQGDACNTNQIDFLSIRNSANQTMLSITGMGDPNGLGTARAIAFGTVFLHPLWKLDKLPQELQQAYRGDSIYLRMSDCQGVRFNNLVATAELPEAKSDGTKPPPIPVPMIHYDLVNECEIGGVVRTRGRQIWNAVPSLEQIRFERLAINPRRPR